MRTKSSPSLYVDIANGDRSAFERGVEDVKIAASERARQLSGSAAGSGKARIQHGDSSAADRSDQFGANIQQGRNADSFNKQQG